MSWFGGVFNDAMTNEGLGTYVRFKAQPNPSGVTSDRGTCASVMNLGWGGDDGVLEVTADQYARNCLQIFGYSYGSKELTLVDDLFKNASTLYIYRINQNGEKAKNSIATAKSAGLRGNALMTVVEADVDAGTIDHILKETTATFSAEGNTITVNVANVPEGATLTQKLSKEDTPVEAEKVQAVQGDGSLTITLDKTLETGTYTCEVFVTVNDADLPLSKATFEVTHTDAKEQTVKITKGSESKKSPDTDYQDYTITWDFESKSNQIVVTYSDNFTSHETHSMYTEIQKGGVEVKADDGKGITKSEDAENHKVTYTFDKTIKVGSDYKVLAYIKDSSGDKKVEISEYTFTTALEGEDVPESVSTVSNEDKEDTDYSASIPGGYFVHTFLDGIEMDVQEVKDATELIDNAFVVFDKGVVLSETAGEPLKGGTDGSEDGRAHADARAALESYSFNILVSNTTDPEIQEAYVSHVQRMREEYGKKFQVLLPVAKGQKESYNYEGVIQVQTTAKDKGYNPSDIVYWFAGLEAGCPVESSVTASHYNGNLTPDLSLTQDQILLSARNGYMVLHRDGDDVVVYKDLNTLTNITYKDRENKNNDFKNNQTIRVLDEIATATATIFNKYKLGRYGNTELNRIALRHELLDHRLTLEAKGAINTYDQESLVVDMGKTIVDVVATENLQVINAMERLFLTSSVINPTI